MDFDLRPFLATLLKILDVEVRETQDLAQDGALHNP